MNIVDAFMSLDKLNEAAERPKDFHNKATWPELELVYPEVDFTTDDDEIVTDLAFSVKGWDVACCLMENEIIKKEDFPEYAHLVELEDSTGNSDAVEKWIFDNFEKVTEKYNQELLDAFENGYEYTKAYDARLPEYFENEYWNEVDHRYDEWRDEQLFGRN